MDDNTTLRAEFTIAGHKVTATQPTGEQIFVLQLTRQAQSTKEGVRTARRLTMILESLLGTDQWDSIIEQGLIDGSISVKQMMELAWSIFAHDWSAEPKPEPETVNVTTYQDPQPVRMDVRTGEMTVVPTEALSTYENEIADALAAGE